MRPGDVVVDRFEIEHLAGTGGMGEVWRARDRADSRPVALKVLKRQDPKHEARFAREAVLLSQLVHPGVVRYVAHGTTPLGDLFLAMEWLDGEDLSAILLRGSLTSAETVDLLRNVAGALSLAHTRGVVHRDLKPSNLFLPRGSIEEVKILDFGVARIGGAPVTRAGEALGTPAYMAPEQARADADLDARVDVFALGCVAFECLTGRRAFDGEHAMAVFAKILLQDPPRVADLIPGVPGALDALVARMLSKERDGRPRDAAELLLELSSLDAGPVGVRELRAPVLGQGEQRILSVVLVGPPSDREGEAGSLDSDVVGAVQRCGGRLTALTDGSLLATVSEHGIATDLAARAARCALAMRARLPRRAIAIATGRSEVGPLTTGEAIDRAARRLEGAGGIEIDDVTAGLLGDRFEIATGEHGFVLESERRTADSGRILLGKQTACVGRERELASLTAMFAECVEEPTARVVIVTGQAGLGKSRLRIELVEELRRRHHEVEIWLARGDPMRVGSTYALLSAALRDACSIVEGEPIEARRSKLEARVARHVPEAGRSRVGQFLAEMIGAPFPDDGSVQLRAARQDAMLMGDQVRTAWQDLLDAECAAGPVLLVLEDLHWGDLPTVKLVDATLRRLQQRPFMVLALARPEVHDLFPELWAARNPQEVRLGGLTRKASERLVRHVLGPDTDAATVTKIVERADGNAFYLEELIRAVADGRGETLPDTVVAMVQARLERLEPEARRLLRAGSVFGATFWKSSVAALVGGPAQLGQRLAELADQELVSRQRSPRFPGEEEYAFRHALLRDGAYAMLTDEDRTLGHRLAGDWLERMGERDAMMLAEHFASGGARERALTWYPRAAEQALEGNDLEAVIARVERGIACGATGPELGVLRGLEAEAQNWRGENAEALRLATEAMTLLPKAGAPWFAAAREAIITAAKVGEVARVTEIVGVIAREPAVGDAVAIRRMALGWGAINLLCGGEYAGAKQILDDLAPSPDEPRAEAVTNKARAMRAGYGGERTEAIRLFEAAAADFERAGDLRNACTTRADLAFDYLELGAYDDAERILGQALAAAERMHLQGVIPQVKHNLGFALMGLGRLDEAMGMEVDASEALRAQGHPRIEGLAQTYLARILLRKQDAPAAEKAAGRAAELLQVAPASRAMAVAVLARALLAQDRADEALAAAREAMGILESLGALEEGEALVRITFAEALHANGDPGAASAIAEASAALHARAERIADPARRQSFLERVEENARTLELARAWSA